MASALVVLGGVGTALAQTTTAPGIDVEIFNADPADPLYGGNEFCAAVGSTITAHLLLRPGDDASIECSADCGAVAGGSANLAFALVDLEFDDSKLGLLSAGNVDVADGLIQDRAGAGRVGWALAGDWVPDGDPTGTLLDPCKTNTITSAVEVLELVFQIDAQGVSELRLRQPAGGFSLSVADRCGSDFPAGVFDEIVHAAVATPASPDEQRSELLVADPDAVIDWGATTGVTAMVRDSGDLPVEGQPVRIELIGLNLARATVDPVAELGGGAYESTLRSQAGRSGRVRLRYLIDACNGTWPDPALPAEDRLVVIRDPNAGCLPGDADGNGAVEAADAAVILREYADGDSNSDPAEWTTTNLTEANPCADVNRVGGLEPTDATAVLQMIAEGF